MTKTSITVTDRNETKFLIAKKFTGTPVPRNATTLDFSFPATEELFQARKAYSLNEPVKVLNFIEASRQVDKLVYEHRQGGEK